MTRHDDTTALFPEAAPASADAPPAAGYAHIALEQNIDVAPAGLTYAIPAALRNLAVGERVRVPLGRKDRPVAGYVITRHDTSDLTNRKAKFILERDPRSLSVGRDLIELARWMASYYCAPIGMVLATMLPAAVKRGTGSVMRTEVGLPEQQGAEGPRGQGAKGAEAAEGAEGAERGSAASAAVAPPKLSKLQRAAVEAAQQRAAEGHAWTEIKHLADLAGARSVSPVKQLVDKGVPPIAPPGDGGERSGRARPADCRAT